MKIIEVKDVDKRPENADIWVLKGVTFDVYEGEFLGIVGPSGCGKSTLLRAMSGLEKPTYGEVLFRGEPVEEPVKEIAMVFQHSALLPWKSLLDNIELPLEARGIEPGKSREIAGKFVEKMGLGGFENSYPREVSEGMRHTTALTRALAIDPEVILLDQPFSSLDAFSAEKLRKLTLDLWKNRKAHTNTFVLVSHSVEEAVSMCDRVLVMSHRPGRVVKELVIDIPRPREEHFRDKEFFGYCDIIKEMMNPKFKPGGRDEKNNQAPKNHR